MAFPKKMMKPRTGQASNPTEGRFGIQITQSMWCRAPRDRTDSWNADTAPPPRTATAGEIPAQIRRVTADVRQPRQRNAS
ncbi:hypothetical protein [Streptomyces sp. NPDC093018]|uniref:hypothetical protein n=1 Tax=Streptomyces sp. NPDC093018 TaxID=3155067 RepID=UPI0034441FA9